LTVVHGKPPPAELERAPQDRIVGLTIEVDQLCAIRQERLRMLGMPPETQYGLREHVEREIAHAERLFRLHPEWPVVDMTGRSVAHGKPPPAELERAPQDRIVGLTIEVDQLCAIRQERLRKLGMPPETQYGLREHVEREIAHAERLFRLHPEWPVVDMTGRSV